MLACHTQFILLKLYHRTKYHFFVPSNQPLDYSVSWSEMFAIFARTLSCLKRRGNQWLGSTSRVYPINLDLRLKKWGKYSFTVFFFIYFLSAAAASSAKLNAGVFFIFLSFPLFSHMFIDPWMTSLEQNMCVNLAANRRRRLRRSWFKLI